MMSPHLSLIEHHELRLDQLLTRSRRKPKASSKKTPSKKPSKQTSRHIPKNLPQKSERLPRFEHMILRARLGNPSPNRMTSFPPILTENFHENFLSGKQGTFDSLMRFLRDETKNPATVGIKNHYLRLLRDFPMSDCQIKQVQQLIWDYAHGEETHRSRIFARLVIKVSSPEFHQAFIESAENCHPKPGWKIHLIRERLDHHCPQTKPH